MNNVTMANRGLVSGRRRRKHRLHGCRVGLGLKVQVENHILPSTGKNRLNFVFPRTSIRSHRLDFKSLFARLFQRVKTIITLLLSVSNAVTYVGPGSGGPRWNPTGNFDFVERRPDMLRETSLTADIAFIFFKKNRHNVMALPFSSYCLHIAVVHRPLSPVRLCSKRPYLGSPKTSRTRSFSKRILLIHCRKFFGQ